MLALFVSTLSHLSSRRRSFVAVFSLRPRAGDGNRTHAACLEGRGSTTELHPRAIQSRPDPPATGASGIRSAMCSPLSSPSVDPIRVTIRPCWESTWVEQDSNLRRRCHQIYSLAPLATWVSTRLGLCRRIRRPTSRRGLAMRRSAPASLDRASGETRTHNLRFTKPLLCQLSYASNQGREITYYIVWFNECKRLPGPIRRTPIGAIRYDNDPDAKPARGDG